MCLLVSGRCGRVGRGLVRAVLRRLVLLRLALRLLLLIRVLLLLLRLWVLLLLLRLLKWRRLQRRL